jgi:hypothetical protein
MGKTRNYNVERQEQKKEREKERKQAIARQELSDMMARAEFEERMNLMFESKKDSA